MKYNEFLDFMGLKEDQVKKTVEPKTSLEKLNAYEEEYKIPSQFVVFLVNEGLKNELFEEWANQYSRFIRYGGNLEDLYLSRYFTSTEEGQVHKSQKPEQERCVFRFFLLLIFFCFSDTQIRWFA